MDPTLIILIFSIEGISLITSVIGIFILFYKFEMSVKYKIATVISAIPSITTGILSIVLLEIYSFISTPGTVIVVYHLLNYEYHGKFLDSPLLAISSGLIFIDFAFLIIIYGSWSLLIAIIVVSMTVGISTVAFLVASDYSGCAAREAENDKLISNQTDV